MSWAHHRRTARLPGRDYGRVGVYFVTIVLRHRLCLLGHVGDGQSVVLNAAGRAVREEWERTPSLRPNIELDEYVVMPNHIHGILVVKNRSDLASAGRGWLQPAPTRHRDSLGRPLVSQTLGSVVRGFKAASTKRVNEIRQTPGGPLWQRNYHEHIVRSPEDLDRIRGYIRANPSRWDRDPENPEGYPDEWELSFWKAPGNPH